MIRIPPVPANVDSFVLFSINSDDAKQSVNTHLGGRLA